jgi:type IV pilus assembly protein PilA
MSTLNSRLQLSILNRKKSKNLAEKGFTLIELLITVVILGVLSAVAVPGFLAQKDKADISAANAQGKSLMTACKTAIVDSTSVDLSLQSAKTFGSITWTPTLGSNGAPSTCQSVTAGSSGGNQSYALNSTTGAITDVAGTAAPVDAS